MLVWDFLSRGSEKTCCLITRWKLGHMTPRKSDTHFLLSQSSPCGTGRCAVWRACASCDVRPHHIRLGCCTALRWRRPKRRRPSLLSALAARSDSAATRPKHTRKLHTDLHRTSTTTHQPATSIFIKVVMLTDAAGRLHCDYTVIVLISSVNQCDLEVAVGGIFE